ncbi:MAG: GcrA family cell cycle regulator [Alphaproteobacteria bacterium]
MTWTEERVMRLRELWTEGLSASQIAAQIGGITRNAVIGKAHRLGLEGRPSPIRSGGPRARPRARVKPVVPQPAPRPGPGLSGVAVNLKKREAPLEPSLQIQATAKAIRGLSGGPSCAWPIGNPGEAEFHFCDRQAVEGRPYCDNHCSMAYIRKDKTAAA